MRRDAVGALRFAGPFVFALSIPALYYLAGPAAPFLTVGALLAALIGAELVAERGSGPPVAPRQRLFRILPNLYVPVQLGVIAWAVVVSQSAGPWSFAAL